MHKEPGRSSDRVKELKGREKVTQILTGMTHEESDRSHTTQNTLQVHFEAYMCSSVRMCVTEYVVHVCSGADKHI